MQMHGFVTKLFDFAFRIFSFKRSKVDHIQSQLEPLNFGFTLDAAFCKPGGSLFHAHLIDAGCSEKCLIARHERKLRKRV
jgi:hypothetical protein